MLDAQAEKAIAQLVEQIRVVFGKELLSITLYGSAAGEDFVPGKSDLNLAIVVEKVSFAHLKALHRHLPRWHKLGAAVPVLFDRHFLEESRDVFPMEFQDIKELHRVLYGEEIFLRLEFDSRHLRYQAEHEARSKLLRLRALYAEVGADRKRLEGLMLDSAKTFIIIMRNFIRLQRREARTRYLEVLDQFERDFGQAFPTIRHLLMVRLGTAHWANGIDEDFRAYLDEVERLIDLINRSLPATEAVGASS